MTREELESAKDKIQYASSVFARLHRLYNVEPGHLSIVGLQELIRDGNLFPVMQARVDLEKELCEFVRARVKDAIDRQIKVDTNIVTDLKL